MNEQASTPELTEAVARLSALLGPRDGGIEPLDGGITNRNFRISFGGNDYMVRMPGKDTNLLGIDREAEHVAARKAAEIGIGAEVAAVLTDPPCLVTAFVEGRELSSKELRAPDMIAEIAQGLRRFHDSDLLLSTEFQVADVAREYANVAREREVEPPPEFDSSLERADAIVGAVRGRSEHEPVPCHNDLLQANFLHDGERVVVVDWEYAGMGDRFFDLGNFSVNNELGDEDEDALLAAYFEEPATPRRRAALKLFRFMSDFREAMWGVVQGSVSDLDFDFGAYASKHFERLARTGEDPRFEEWLEEARDSSS